MSFGEAADRVGPLIELARSAGDDEDDVLDMVSSELGWNQRWAAVVVAMHNLYQLDPSLRVRARGES